MKGFVPDYELTTAKDLQSALFVLSQGKIKPFAGGTDLMVQFEAGKLPVGAYLDISRVPELKGITIADDHVEIGSLSTYSEILHHPVLKTEFPLLGEAARLTGAVAIQNRGTIGGNIANASPAADTPPALLVYGTEIEIASQSGNRVVVYENFHQGYKKMDLKPGELIAKIRIKRNTAGWKHYYRKVGTRKAQAISKVCIAATAKIVDGRCEHVHIAMGSVAPIPLRMKKVESLVKGEVLNGVMIDNARQVALSELVPIDDIRSTKEYRLDVAANLVADFLRSL